MLTPHRSFLERVGDLFKRRSRKARRGQRASLRVEQLEPRWTMSGMASISDSGTNATDNVAAAVANSVTDEFKLRLAVTDTDGNAVTALSVGQTFELSIYATDLRAISKGGPFAAYLNVAYDSGLVSAASTPIQYGPDFTTAKSGDTSTAGLISEVGGSGNSLSPIGTSEFLVATVTLEATAAGTASFTGLPSQVLPGHNILVYGQDSPVDQSQVIYGTTSVVIGTVQGLQVNPATFTVDGDTTNNSLDVLANDLVPTGTDDQPVVSQVEDSTSQGGTVSITSGGASISYTPKPGFVGTDNFTYTVTAGGATSQGQVTVNVLPPVQANSEPGLTVTQGSKDTFFDVLANDIGNPVIITAVGAPSSGGSAFIGGNGTYIDYSPSPFYTGEETFTYTITDAAGITSTVTDTVNVVANPNAPTAIDQNFVVNEGSTNNSLPVLTGDSVAAGGTLIVRGISGSPQGSITIAADGSSLAYSPPVLFTGTDSFFYIVDDSIGNSAEAKVTVTVQPAPTANGDFFSVDKNATVQTLNVLGNDFSDSTNPLTVMAVTAGSAGGTVTIAPGGTGVLYTPQAGYTGGDTFTYTISDGIGHTATGNVYVDVEDPNEGGPLGTTITGTVVGGPGVSLGPTFTGVSNPSPPSTVSNPIPTAFQGAFSLDDEAIAFNVFGMSNNAESNATVFVSATPSAVAIMAAGNSSVASPLFTFLQTYAAQGGSITAHAGDGIAFTLVANPSTVFNNFVPMGSPTPFGGLTDLLASQSRSDVLMAAGKTSGQAGVMSRNGWSDPFASSIAVSSNRSSLLTSAVTSTGNSFGGERAKTANVEARHVRWFDVDRSDRRRDPSSALSVQSSGDASLPSNENHPEG